MKTLISRFVKDESGATAIEYGLIAGLISIAAVGAMTLLGDSLGTMFGSVSSALDAVAPSTDTGTTTTDTTTTDTTTTDTPAGG